MKILFCAYDRPCHIATGPNAWLQRLIPDLRNKWSMDITVLFYYHGQLEECPTLEYFKNQGLPYLAFSITKNPYIVDQTKYLLKSMRYNNFSILIANLVIPAFYAAKYLKKQNIPTVAVLHSNDVFYKGVIRKFISTGEISHSVSVSNYINNLIPNKQIANLVIPCGTPITSHKSCFSGDVLKIIYAGRLVEEAKQISKLTKAFCHAASQNKNLSFTIIGDGPMRTEVERIIEESKLLNVRLLPALPPTSIINEISKHHVFTLLSDYEGMPIALMEAMGCGLVPVCMATESGIDEIIHHGVNGFIVKDRGADYLEKIDLLYKQPELWQTMSINAKETILTQYSNEVTELKWSDLLKNIPTNNKRIKVPIRITIEGELLAYGDNRKPNLRIRLKKGLHEQWWKIKLHIRPRARIRALFNH